MSVYVVSSLYFFFADVINLLDDFEDTTRDSLSGVLDLSGEVMIGFLDKSYE